MLARNSVALTLLLPSDREIVLTRVFAAPRRLVFEAWTRPEHVRQWYGCGEFTLSVCEIDLRAGGAYRYILHAPDGSEHTMQGVYREVVPPARVVYTEQYVARGFSGDSALVTVLFAEHSGLTTLTSTILHRSKEARDAHLGSGIETGADTAYCRLEEHLATMA